MYLKKLNFLAIKPFTSEFLTKNVLELIFKKVSIKESRRESKLSPEYLYHYGKGCNYFILILSGEATIEVGKEKLEFPAGPFAVFGTNALLCGAETADDVLHDDSDLTSHQASTSMLNEDSRFIKKFGSKLYVPDFSLRVDDRCVYLKLDRDLWRSGVVKSQYEIRNNELSDNIDYIPHEDSSFDLLAAEAAAVNVSVPRVEFSLNNNSIYKSHGLIKNLEQGSLNLKSGRRSTIASVIEKTSNARSSPLTPTSQKMSRTNLQITPLAETIENGSNLKTSFTIQDIKDENSNLLNAKLNEPNNQSVSIELDEEKQPFLDRNNNND